MPTDNTANYKRRRVLNGTPAKRAKRKQILADYVASRKRIYNADKDR
jgi:hypothetical protein